MDAFGPADPQHGWTCKIKETKDCSLALIITPSNSCVIGEWLLSIMTSHSDKGYCYELPEDINILLNPWCKGIWHALLCACTWFLSILQKSRFVTYPFFEKILEKIHFRILSVECFITIEYACKCSFKRNSLLCLQALNRSFLKLVSRWGLSLLVDYLSIWSNVLKVSIFPFPRWSSLYGWREIFRRIHFEWQRSLVLWKLPTDWWTPMEFWTGVPS